MRKVLGLVSAIAGGLLLYWAFKLARVLLILEDQSVDGTMIAIAAVTGAVGAGLMGLGWMLFRDPVKPPPSPPGTPQP